MTSRNKYNTTTSKTTTGGGVGICTVLFLIFLVLKLINVIDWSWWWVTAPLWIPFGLIITIFIVTFIVLFIVGIIKYIIRVRREKNGSKRCTR